jgi:hypothetical protein
MKIKCVRLQCPICNKSGSCQLFMNRLGQVRYARVRHYSHIDKESKKPQFTYCKIEDLQQLETLLISFNLQFPQTQQKQLGHTETKQLHDHTSVSLLSGQPDSSLKLKLAGPLGFEPRTFSLEG